MYTFGFLEEQNKLLEWICQTWKNAVQKYLRRMRRAQVAEGNERKRNPKQPVFEFFAVLTKKTGLLKFIGVRLNLLIYEKFKPIFWL